jgi:CheY-like chemotaxis protein
MADLLVVDDDLDGAAALVELLRLAGHRVRVAYDGAEALRLVQERAPEVALVDVEMPVLDGPSMAHQMFVRDAGLESIPIVLVSGVPGLREVAAIVGTPYYVSKPYRHTHLLEVLSRAQAEHVPPRPARLPSAGRASR